MCVKKRIAYIIPGWGASRIRPEYLKIAQFFRNRGIQPVKVPIPWYQKFPLSADNYVQDFLLRYSHDYFHFINDGGRPEIYVIGFGYGAFAAVATAPAVEPNGLILCSLPPAFLEVNGGKPNVARFGKKACVRNNQPLQPLVEFLPQRTSILVGDGEGDANCVATAKLAHSKIPGSSFTLVPEAGHDISHPNYLRTIEEIIMAL
jgi:hypothetical protein